MASTFPVGLVTPAAAGTPIVFAADTLPAASSNHRRSNESQVRRADLLPLQEKVEAHVPSAAPSAAVELSPATASCHPVALGELVTSNVKIVKWVRPFSHCLSVISLSHCTLSLPSHTALLHGPPTLPGPPSHCPVSLPALSLPLSHCLPSHGPLTSLPSLSLPGQCERGQ